MAGFGNWKAEKWIAADVVRVNDGVLAEHWDVLWTKHRSRVAKRSADVRDQVSGLREASSLRQFQTASVCGAISRETGNQRAAALRPDQHRNEG
jgi:hypothetical protein